MVSRTHGKTSANSFRDQWGLDHGTWSVLAHMYPDADIPVIQLSINALKPLDYHLKLAASLAPLRDRGVMIVASGNVVHNLGTLQWKRQDLAYDWAERFDDAVVDQLAQAPGDILRVREHAVYELAVPTPDHFIPLLYIASLAATDNAPLDPLVRGYTMGSISMSCFGTGTPLSTSMNVTGNAAQLPDGIPPRPDKYVKRAGSLLAEPLLIPLRWRQIRRRRRDAITAKLA